MSFSGLASKVWFRDGSLTYSCFVFVLKVLFAAILMDEFVQKFESVIVFWDCVNN